MDSIAKRFLEELRRRVENSGHPVVWNGPRARETSCATGACFEEDEREGIPISNLFYCDCIQKYAAGAFLELREDSAIVNVELERACHLFAGNLSVFFHSGECMKMTIRVDGNLVGVADRVFSLNFVNKEEYCIHVYDREGNMRCFAFIRI